MKKKNESAKKTKSLKKVSPKKSTKKVVKKTNSTKKSVGKKPSAAKVKRKRVVKIPLVYAADWQVFYAVNGAALRSLVDLFGELETMREDEYLYHKENGDHFVTWVREVLGDDACAKDLSGAATRKKARAVLKKHLVRYKL